MKSKTIIRYVTWASFGIALILSHASLSGCSKGDWLSINIFGFNRKVRGSGTLAREIRELERVSEVILSEEGDLQIEIGEREQLIMEAEDNLLEYLAAEVNDGSLDIKKRPDNVQLDPTRPIRYTLTVKSLDSLIVKNSGDVEITDIDGAHFGLRITGSGDVRINNLNVDTLEVELTSSGDLTISEGSAEDQNIRVTSSGSYDGNNVVCQRAQVSLSSSGEATVNVLETLTASTTSSGNVYYIGNPPHVSIQATTSSGKVIRYRQ